MSSSRSLAALEATRLLEAQARTRCEALRFEWRGALRTNVRKQTVTARVCLPEGSFGVVKWVSPGESRAAFDVERDFYQSLHFELAPTLRASGPDFLLLEQVQATALREWLSSANREDELSSVLLRVTDALAARRQSSDQGSAERAAAHCASRLRNLLTSGPFDIKRSPSANLVAARFAKVVMPVVKRALLKLYQRWSSRGVAFESEFGHNDLHADNVLVGPSNVWVIDYEKLTRPGAWHVDILYLLAAAYAATRDETERNSALARVVERVCSYEPRMQPELGILARLFAMAGMSNSRFRGTTWSDATNFWSMLNLLGADHLPLGSRRLSA